MDGRWATPVTSAGLPKWDQRLVPLNLYGQVPETGLFKGQFECDTGVRGTGINCLVGSEANSLHMDHGPRKGKVKHKKKKIRKSDLQSLLTD